MRERLSGSETARNGQVLAELFRIPENRTNIYF